MILVLIFVTDDNKIIMVINSSNKVLVCFSVLEVITKLLHYLLLCEQHLQMLISHSERSCNSLK